MARGTDVNTSDVSSRDGASISSEQPPVVAFDVDKTLVVRDCVFPFMVEIVGRSRMGRLLAANATTLGRMAAARDRDGIKALLVRAVFGGRAVDEVRARGSEFAQKVAESWIRDDVGRRLRFHQQSGHRVVLVSASLDPYLDPLGEIIGVHRVLCTRLHADDAGLYTGEIIGSNCRGVAKVVALEAAFGPLGVDNGSTLAFAYGDSRGDQAMLLAASVGVNVSRTTLSESW